MELNTLNIQQPGKNRSYIIALFISFLLHLFLLFSIVPLTRLGDMLDLRKLFGNEAQTVEESVPEPIVFELVETPEDAAAETPSEATWFISDKNARARDSYTGDDLDQGIPYSDGQVPFKVFAGESGAAAGAPVAERSNTDRAAQKAEEQALQSETTESKDGDVRIIQSSVPTKPAQSFDRNLLSGQENARTGQTFSDDLNWENRITSTDDLGGISLNTYAWDYAPYLLYMKRRLREHTYPPPAFYQMGAISGEIVLRFRVHKDGSMSDLQLIGYRGHKALVETSLNAVKASTPFRPLPDGFPESYLELTWTFIYYILR